MKVSEGFTVVLYMDGDDLVLEYHHQQSTDVEENSMTFCHRWSGLEFLSADRGWVFQLHACSFSCGLKVVAAHHISHHSSLLQHITLCLVVLQMFQQ
jgi:hypothetical protein